jgi:hypothetical protein
MAKWPNHFISGKQFQKRPNGNPALKDHFQEGAPDKRIKLFQPTKVSVKKLQNIDNF